MSGPRRYPVPHDSSLVSLRDWTKAAARSKEGAVCPCCDQIAKVYKRSITSSMAYVLLLIERYDRSHPDDRWLQVPEYLSEVSALGAPVRGGDWAKLRYWSLIEPKEGVVRDDGSLRAGIYRLTELGRLFALNLTTVARHAYIYNGALLKLDQSKQVGIIEALGAGFDYDELMQRRAG